MTESLETRLAEALRGQSVAVLAAACVALKAAGRPAGAFVPLLIPGLEHPSTNVVWVAIHALGSAGKGSLQAEGLLLSVANAQEPSYLRSTALKALGELNSPSPAVLATLRAALQAPSEYYCQIGIEGLAALTAQAAPAAAALITVLNHPSSDVWYVAQGGLTRLAQASPEALDIVQQALDHPDFKVRRVLLKVLGAAGKGSEKVARALVGALKDPDQNVYSWVPEALVAADSDFGHSVPLLTALVQNKKEENVVRCHAIKTLGLLGKATPELLRLLIATLNEPGLRFDHAWMLRFASVEALGLLGKGSPEVRAALVALLPEDTNLHHVATALGRVGKGTPKVAALLTEVVNDCTLEPQKAKPMSPYALRALGSAGVPSPEAVQAATRALAHEDAAVREAAAEVLGVVGVGSPQAASALCALLGDSSAQVQEAAARSLGRLGLSENRIVQALLATKSRFAAVTEAQVEALRLLAERDPSVLPQLSEALQSAEWEVREVAQEVLQARSPQQRRPEPPKADPESAPPWEECLAAIQGATLSVQQAAHQAVESLSWLALAPLRAAVERQLTLAGKVVSPQGTPEARRAELVAAGIDEALAADPSATPERLAILRNELDQLRYE